jgi:hypothetical protein
MVSQRENSAEAYPTEAGGKNCQKAEDLAFADKLAKRLPPNEIERAEIDKARERTKARAPRVAMHVEDRRSGARVRYADHSDDEGHRYRLADAFGTRSLQFVYSMLNGLGKATADHSVEQGFSPGNSDEESVTKVPPCLSLDTWKFPATYWPSNVMVAL